MDEELGIKMKLKIAYKKKNQKMIVASLHRDKIRFSSYFADRGQPFYYVKPISRTEPYYCQNYCERT